MKKIIISALLATTTLFAGAQTKPAATKPTSTTAVKPAQKIDRSKRPVAGPAPEIKLGKIESFTLANGLKVFVVENHKLPKVAFSIQLDIDPALEKENKGVSDIAGQLLETGTINRTKDKLNEEIDFIGATFSTSSDGVYGESLKKHQEKLLDLMSDVVLNASFKKEELDKIKTKTLSGLATQKDDPDAISNNVRAALVFGKNHPYGEITTEKSVENISLDKCINYYKTYFKPNVAYMAIVGDITLAEAKPLVEKYFSAWEKGNVPTAKYDFPKDPGKTRVAVVNKAGAVQSVINVAYPLDLKLSSPDLIKARVLNNILGGNASSRLFMNLREKHGWTYGSYSRITDDELAGNFRAFAKVRNPVSDSSITEMLNEMNRLRTEKVSTSELEGIKNYMTGTFAISLENPQTVANMAINMERYNLPKDFYANYLKNLAAVSVDDISAMAQKYIRPDNCWIIAVGSKDELAAKLKPFAPQGLEFYDNYGDVAKEAKAVPEGVTAQSVVDAYVQAIGGKAKLEKVKDISMKMTVSVQGMNLEMESYQKAPNKYMSSMKMNGMVLQKQVYDGKRGKASGMQGAKELEGDDLKEMESQAVMFNEMKYAQLGYKMELKGIEEVNGKDAYVLDLTSPTGHKETELYDVKTSLKVKTIKTEDGGQQGPMTSVSEISDYREVSGIKFPFEIAQSVGPQSMKMKVSSIEVNKKVNDDVFKIE
ncbi:MAG: insulinase family protein [Bacteroidia bacterium]|nr:insulinase family protein [Bacteroidia bacterium]